MSEKQKAPATVAPTTPSNSQKGTERKRPRGGKKLRAIRAKEAKRALLAAAEAGSVAGTEIAARPASPPAPSPRAPSSQVPSPPISGELARTTTLADLVPGFPLSDVNVEELADFLPDIIKNFVEECRMDRRVQN
ncbi:hypothetical protein N7465_001438 [Penicillium sp. CMV-2018d]|nr:hypothetical protein N7465_001438 [Penicillium sp. CMV-2018d]